MERDDLTPQRSGAADIVHKGIVHIVTSSDALMNIEDNFKGEILTRVAFIDRANATVIAFFQYNIDPAFRYVIAGKKAAKTS